jgi:hypothetical protein
MNVEEDHFAPSVRRRVTPLPSVTCRGVEEESGYSPPSTKPLVEPLPQMRYSGAPSHTPSTIRRTPYEREDQERPPSVYAEARAKSPTRTARTQPEAPSQATLTDLGARESLLGP